MNKPDANQPVVFDHCSHCRNRVGGFPGDYAKCKCGAMTILPADPPAGWRTVSDPARLKVLPFFLVTLFYASIAAIFMTGGGSGLGGGAIVVIVFAMWIYAIMNFSATAEKQPGWWICVLEYHIASLGMLCCFFVVLPRVMEALSGQFGSLISLPMLGAVTGLLICLLIYGDARRRVAHLRIVKA